MRYQTPYLRLLWHNFGPVYKKKLEIRLMATRNPAGNAPVDRLVVEIPTIYKIFDTSNQWLFAWISEPPQRCIITTHHRARCLARKSTCGELCFSRSGVRWRWLQIAAMILSWNYDTIPYLPSTWVFPKIEVPQNGWFIMENLIKWMIWGYPYFLETSTSTTWQFCWWPFWDGEFTWPV